MMDDFKKLEKSVFNTLYEIDTKEREREKDTGKTTLNYLPWAVVYSEVCKRYDDVHYEFLRQAMEVEKVVTYPAEDGSTVTETQRYVREVPYFDTGTGLEVRTRVTINGVTKEMNLPVYDTQNRSLGLEAYTVKTKNGASEVKAAHFDDIYKSIMRCFAKNLSMWGVGLHMWTKEEAAESVLQMSKLQADCMALIQSKSKLSPNTLVKVQEVCKNLLPDENGDPRLCDDEEKLKILKKTLSGIRIMK